MISTRRLVIAATTLALAAAMPWQIETASAGGKDAPATPVVAKDEPAASPAPNNTPAADPQADEAKETAKTKPSTAHLLTDPKPLSDEVKKGLKWLASQQLDSGGWGQGEESAQMQRGQGKHKLADTANVGDTCAAALTLIRSGSTPSSGSYDINLQKAIGYVCESIESADEKDLYVTTIRNTRLQSKLGTYVDTFLAAQLLSEVKGKMADDKANTRVDACLDKVIKKIETHQGKDGKFGGRGWAMALNDAIAGKALNRAAQAGAAVDPEAIEKSRRNAEALSAPASPDGKFAAAAEDTAGIELYGAANSVGGQREADTTYRQQIEKQRDEIRGVLEQAKEQAGEDEEGQAIKVQADKALQQLAQAGDDIEASEGVAVTVSELATRLRESEAFDMDNDKIEGLAQFAISNTNWAGNKKNLQVAQDAIVNRLKDDRFVAGFGNNGGEEFLSYTSIGESLYLEGGEAWEQFDEKMTKNLTNVQNKDGSWSGHHCITGRTFCTATALSVLMTDRMHVPDELLEAARAELADQPAQDEALEVAE